MSAALWLLALLSLGAAVEASRALEDTGAAEGVRGIYHGLKKLLKKKHLMPALLLAYKMKALLGLVTTKMALWALGGASGLAALFFALFAVAMCTVVEHEHHRHARLLQQHHQLLEAPDVLRALEAI
ncbi:uncharacterized protein LOC124174163 [Ischnura elegans]|uniref:uncharacterized protein LOC124174163 n=1 Tax=Ischnura elegans TaxID=197161 RepID=UPI001ED88EF2|nr:uncharacterized protein LOC124174163 [Ischnura elegans]